MPRLLLAGDARALRVVAPHSLRLPGDFEALHYLTVLNLEDRTGYVNVHTPEGKKFLTALLAPNAAYRGFLGPTGGLGGGFAVISDVGVKVTLVGLLKGQIVARNYSI